MVAELSLIQKRVIDVKELLPLWLMADQLLTLSMQTIHQVFLLLLYVQLNEFTGSSPGVGQVFAGVRPLYKDRSSFCLNYSVQLLPDSASWCVE